MKKNVFTRVMSIVLTIVPLISIAQTVHNVTVGPGMTYTPASLSINQGDIVSWTSLGGTHDVNFALNSITGESFENPAEVLSLPIQGAGEMGSITFDVPGTYNYDCSVGSHALMGMVGSVSVIQNVDQDLSSQTERNEELPETEQRSGEESPVGLRRTTKKTKPPEFLNYTKLGGEVSAINADLQIDCTNYDSFRNLKPTLRSPLPSYQYYNNFWNYYPYAYVYPTYGGYY